MPLLQVFILANLPASCFELQTLGGTEDALYEDMETQTKQKGGEQK